MEATIKKLDVSDFPSLLKEIPDPPSKLYLRGNLPKNTTKLLTIVGSRKYSSYGKQVIEYLVDGLRGLDIGIVSGLALGIDSLAHRAALRNNLYTLAVPGSGLNDNVIYPQKHLGLAREILENNGGLLSEYDSDMQAAPWTFPRRNRILTGLSHATLLIEAGEKSGTLISAKLATDYNREVLAVPGNIFSPNSIGCHQFIKLGAMPITKPEDILEILGIETSDSGQINMDIESLDQDKKYVLNNLTEPTDQDSLIRNLNLPTDQALTLLTELELLGYIKIDKGVVSRNF